MIPFKHTRFVAIATLFLLAACKKDALVTQAPADQVLTPVGFMDKTKVHFIGDGFALNVSHGRLQKIDHAGKLVEDFGEVKPLEDRYNPGKSAFVPAASGWIAYAYWSNPNTSNPITYFTTNWTVPSAPTRQGSQTIFLFNGMQDGLTSTSYIIQPVLQWGPSAAGGGRYWAITNWYVSSSQAFYGSLATVSTGTQLQGIMQETAVSGGNYSYYCYFTGYPSSTALQVNNVPEAFWAAETLESYGVTNTNTMYPPNTDVAMGSIQILQGSANASLSWSTAQAVSGSAQRAVVVSNASPGGLVDIYFR